MIASRSRPEVISKESESWRRYQFIDLDYLIGKYRKNILHVGSKEADEGSHHYQKRKRGPPQINQGLKKCN
jgi:hypothetical protein